MDEVDFNDGDGGEKVFLNSARPLPSRRKSLLLNATAEICCPQLPSLRQVHIKLTSKSLLPSSNPLWAPERAPHCWWGPHRGGTHNVGKKKMKRKGSWISGVVFALKQKSVVYIHWLRIPRNSKPKWPHFFKPPSLTTIGSNRTTNQIRWIVSSGKSKSDRDGVGLDGWDRTWWAEKMREIKGRTEKDEKKKKDRWND